MRSILFFSLIIFGFGSVSMAQYRTPAKNSHKASQKNTTTKSIPKSPVQKKTLPQHLAQKKAAPAAAITPKASPSQHTQKAEAHNGIEPIQIVRNEYIMLRRLPHNEKALLKLFGERPKREERHIQNHHDQSMDTVVKLSFNKADMDLYADKSRPEYVNFLGMTLNERKKRLEGVLPLQVESTREELEKLFEVSTDEQDFFEMCELQEVTEAGPIYSSSCVVFSFEDNKITKIDWALPLD